MIQCSNCYIIKIFLYGFHKMKNNGSQQKQNFDDLQLFFGFDQRHSFVFTRSERRSRYQDSVHLFGTNFSSLPKVKKHRKGVKGKELSIC